MNRKRLKKYRQLKEIRQERDYQIGKLQFANRPYSKPSMTIRGRKKYILTTNRFIKKNNIYIYSEV
jgi:hypothetical protein